ncbi:Csu type fimbrial protein [Cupriavidus agavae]|uniref:Spore coat protein U-like protein n=1 Tax=Cupriavidus agavae TaxID=1001822 RepID=A0A4Q7S035_9BURK|nr:spore coat U domain-containing protein [Cupriavidus agavae]RZT39465.1 spore coat protein U-like protein [Cupriavidus agavae]
MTTRFRKGLSLALFASLLTPTWLGAATKTTTFAVRLTLTADCNIAASDLDFGSQGVLAANVDQTSTLSVTCSTSAPYQVGLDGGNAAGSTIANRLMTNAGAATVQYQIYRDSNRTQVWGNTPGTDTVGGTGSGAAQTLTMYGRVPPQTTPAAGTYTTTVTATINF